MSKFVAMNAECSSDVQRGLPGQLHLAFPPFLGTLLLPLQPQGSHFLPVLRGQHPRLGCQSPSGSSTKALGPWQPCKASSHSSFIHWLIYFCSLHLSKVRSTAKQQQGARFPPKISFFGVTRCSFACCSFRLWQLIKNATYLWLFEMIMIRIMPNNSLFLKHWKH